VLLVLLRVGGLRLGQPVVDLLLELSLLLHHPGVTPALCFDAFARTWLP
jgi:hypothetical protein